MILVVDDDAGIPTMPRLTLEASGYPVAVTDGTGHAELESHLVLLDLRLAMSAREAARAGAQAMASAQAGIVAGGASGGASPAGRRRTGTRGNGGAEATERNHDVDAGRD